MRLIFTTIVAAATLISVSTPALAGGEGERGHYNNRDDHDDDRGKYHNNRGHQPGHSRSERRDNRHYDNRGARYWGPSGHQWSRWDNKWGDANRYARQWGFDRYDHNRGWQRGNTWYASPNQWSDWGGWNWSFSVGSGSTSHSNFGNNWGHNSSGYHQQNANCTTYRTQDWVNGRRAIVTYQGCADRWGQVFEQPGTRRVERWGW